MKPFVIAVVSAAAGAMLCWLLLAAGSEPRVLPPASAELTTELVRMNERLARIEQRLDSVHRADVASPQQASPSAQTAPHHGGTAAGAEGDPVRAEQARAAQAQTLQLASTYVDDAIQAGVWTRANDQELDRQLRTLGPQGLALRQRLNMAINSGKLKRSR